VKLRLTSVKLRLTDLTLRTTGLTLTTPKPDVSAGASRRDVRFRAGATVLRTATPPTPSAPVLVGEAGVRTVAHAFKRGYGDAF
jgi:hypothetical protein